MHFPTALASFLCVSLVGMAIATAGVGSGATVAMQSDVEMACIAAIGVIRGGFCRRRFLLWITIGTIQCERQNLRFVHERPFFVLFVCFVHGHQVGRRPCS